MKAGVGFSTEKDARTAGTRAVEGAMARSGAPVFILLLTTDLYDPEAVLAGVRQVAGNASIVGCCGVGILTRDRVIEQGVGVLALSGKSLRAVTSIQAGLGADPFGAGQRAGEALLASGIISGCVVVLPNGFAPCIAEMLRGLYDKLGPCFQYIGGGSGDSLKFAKTFQFTEKGVEQDGVAVALIGGLSVETNLAHGWEPIGEPVVVTRAAGKKVIEMDGLPAFATYSRRLGGIRREDFLQVGMRHPLGFPDVYGHYLIRDPGTVNPDESIDFITEIPQNAVGYIMRGEVADLVKTAGEVSASTVTTSGEARTFAMVFDCVSRFLLMGTDFGRELDAISRPFAPEMPLIGMLSVGEVGGLSGDVPLFHNKTTVVAAGAAIKENHDVQS